MLLLLLSNFLPALSLSFSAAKCCSGNLGRGWSQGTSRAVLGGVHEEEHPFELLPDEGGISGGFVAREEREAEEVGEGDLRQTAAETRALTHDSPPLFFIKIPIDFSRSVLMRLTRCASVRRWPT